MTTPLQTLGLQQAKTELEEAKSLMFTNHKDFPGVGLTASPHHQLIDKIGKALNWIEALQEEQQ